MTRAQKNTPLLLACMNSLERTAKFLVEKFATIPQRNDEVGLHCSFTSSSSLNP